jgi:hypothetical protein
MSHTINPSIDLLNKRSQSLKLNKPETPKSTYMSSRNLGFDSGNTFKLIKVKEKGPNKKVPSK